ncbi:MAG: HlyD family efflux transporter periplasmic adaptor subunit [Planctomycetota bacterium]|nr:MAG: HlyD family efflux transporter periplasmic adaptor subunit [Planctomycetota bacterium]REK20939.1 MAG: HlyD family efflux transporter periplasmic adaptor subunit [Planctomycetota bacterium]REK37279.1 MAG: HlyD family efflux transporter periplasmic adaptor subunit [Planctomycetota bacterium]
MVRSDSSRRPENLATDEQRRGDARAGTTMDQPAANHESRSSADRPVPLQRRSDLVVEFVTYRGVPWPVVKDPCGLKYYRLQPEQYRLLQLLDGRRSLAELRRQLQQTDPHLHVTLAEVQALLADLHAKGLAFSLRPGQAAPLIQRRRREFWKQVRRTVSNPLYLKIRGWDPDRFLTRTLPLVQWAFQGWAVAGMAVLVLSSWLFLAMRFDDVRQRLPEFQQFFGWPNLLFLWVTLGAAKVLHEFGHGYACKYFGRECHSMGVMLLVFSPTLYCDVTDAWMLKSKWKRIAIAAAGMWVEVVLAAVAIFVWWNTRPGLLHHLCLNVFFVSTATTVIFNANPLLRFDGYYMLADLLEIPNLRPKASRLFQQTWAWYCLGVELPDDPFMPVSGRFWFVLYTIASKVYMAIILAGITVFLYTVLKPYRLQSIGIALAAVSLTTMLMGAIVGVVHVLRMPREEPMSRPKLAVTGVLAVCLIAGVLFVPIPWYVSAPFTLEPVGVQHVYATNSGTLNEIGTTGGDSVAPGQLLAVLESPELADELRKLETEQSARRIARDMAIAQADPDARALIESELASLAERKQNLDRQAGQLEIRAPVGGRLIDPPRLVDPVSGGVRERLATWTGRPLEPGNRGCLIEEGTLLCSIAPDDRYHAVLLVDQESRDELAVGQPVRLKIEDLADLTLERNLKEISPRSRSTVPPALSNKFGGPLATVTDADGSERLTGRAFEATVPVDVDPRLVRTGFRGEARIRVRHRSLGGWIYRWLRSTFKFRM